MKNFLGILTLIVAWLYLAKIILQMAYYKANGIKFWFGPNNTIGPNFFKKIKPLKEAKLFYLATVGNLIQYIAYLYITIVIGGYLYLVIKRVY